jgi:hypothetical protein
MYVLYCTRNRYVLYKHFPMVLPFGRDDATLRSCEGYRYGLDMDMDINSSLRNPKGGNARDQFLTLSPIQ